MMLLNELSQGIADRGVHGVNFNEERKPTNLLKEVLGVCLSAAFPNIVVALRIFISLPASVPSGERTFNELKQIKKYHCFKIGQERLSGLAMLNINSDIARKLDFSKIILLYYLLN